MYSFDDGTLILEDLSDNTVRSKSSSCDYHEAEVILMNISKIHGIYWNDKRIPKDDSHIFSNVIQYSMEQCWKLYYERYYDLLDETKEDFIWFWENSELLSAIYQPKNGTLVHGDLHLENILFSPSQRNTHYIIDWQLSSFRSPAFDLSFFLVQSLDSKYRSDYERILLKKHYEHLTDNVKEIYTFERLLLEYRACLTRSMLSLVMMIGPRFSSFPNQMEISDLIAERVITAVKELQPQKAVHDVIAN